jgi:ribonuclease P protein component
VLPASHRLSSGADLRRVARRGRRSGSSTLVVHLLPVDQDEGAATPSATRVGFVVSRAVGNSVLRHRVQRRLRHLCRDRVDGLPTGTELVVRALAPAAHASYQELGTDLDRCLERALASVRDAGPGTVS